MDGAAGSPRARRSSPSHPPLADVTAPGHLRLRRRGRWWIGLGLALLVPAACADDPTPPGTAAPAGVDLAYASSGAEGPTNTTTAELPLGQCVDVTGLRVGEPVAPSAVHLAPCDTPHGGEVFAVVSLPGTPAAVYPGVDILGRDTTDRCVENFPIYTGSAYKTSALDVATVVPTAEAWNQGDRGAVCVAYDSSLRPLTMSVRDSAR
jgi:hypothetical protein